MTDYNPLTTRGVHQSTKFKVRERDRVYEKEKEEGKEEKNKKGHHFLKVVWQGIHADGIRNHMTSIGVND